MVDDSLGGGFQLTRPSEVASIAGAAVGALAAGMYLDAKYFIRNDLRQGPRRLGMVLGMRYIAQKARENKLLYYSLFEDRAGTAEGDNIALMFEDRQWTYREFFMLSIRLRTGSART